MTAWNAGDIVIYNEDSSWVGGKGRVVGRNSYSKEFTVRVKLLELPPALKDSPHLLDTFSNHRPTDLLPYKPKDEAVEHPSHYGGKDNPYEVIKVAEAWGLDKDAYLFNVLKYVARAGKKGDRLEDLKKGLFYYNRKIKNLESAK